MATLRHDQVRARIAAALEGLTVATGTLYEAPCGYDAMPGDVAHGRVHLAFGVAISSTSIVPAQRQGTPSSRRPLLCQSTVAVRLLHRHRGATAARTDVDGALQVEGQVLAGVLDTAGTDGLMLSYARTPRRLQVADPADAFMVELEFLASYNILTT